MALNLHGTPTFWDYRLGVRVRTGSVVSSTQQPLDVFKPVRDRPVASRVVACSRCGAPIGQPCLTATGNETSAAHTSRRAAALREEG